MTAGVQNLEPAAYLPPPSASSSRSDAKGVGSADTKGTDAKDTDTPGALSDFQSELQLQDTGAQKAKPADPKDPKAGSGKSGKKRDARSQDADLSTATLVQLAEPQKQILPLVITFAKPDDAEADSQVDAQTTADKDTRSEDNQAPATQAAQELPLPIAARIQLVEPAQGLGQPVKLRPSTKNALPTQTTDGKAPSVTPEVLNTQILTSSAPLPAREDAAKSGDQSPASQPASPAAFQLPAATPEPVAKAIQETTESEPSSPAALAFAARLAVTPQKGNPSTPASLSQSPAVSGSQTPAQIPVRYAATAPILAAAAVDTKQGDGPKKDVAGIDRLYRTDARIVPTQDMRTDMVAPRIETAREAAPTSSQVSPPPPAPAARLEPIIEPPAAAPTSPHDIRVRVPDNNGGSTQVRFVESGGEVRVSVRTADEGLAWNLRSHLSDLTQRLADGGMPAEIWKPGSTAASSQNDQHQPDREGRGNSGQGSGGQSGQQDRQQKRPAWLEEMETSLHGEQA
jgi:hypothetical protein